MGECTRVGCGLWDWLPFVELDLAERNLWQALYTSGPAKRICTGLWHGDHYLMASAAKMRPDDVLTALNALMKGKTCGPLVEFDRRLSVLRFTQLPDAHERPTSWKALKGMWNGFVTVPRCAVRDRHVPLLRHLLDQGNVSQDMETTWRQTFGTIPPPLEASSPSELFDSDTSTKQQPGLFSKPVMLLGSAMTLDSVSIPPGSGMGSGRDPDRDQDREPPAVLADGSRPVLQLVPATAPFVEPGSAAPEPQNERAAQMSAALREAAAETGTSWLVK